MAIDLQRILEAAAKAAVEQSTQAVPASLKPKKRRLSTGRAMLLGAGLATAGRLVVRHKGADILGRVQERMAGSSWLEDQEPDDSQDYEPEAWEDEELPSDDEEVVDDSPQWDLEPDADPDENETEHEEIDADEDESQEAEPKRPTRRRTRQSGRA